MSLKIVAVCLLLACYCSGIGLVVVQPPILYQTEWYNQTLDHFNFETVPRRYMERFLWNDTFWGTVKPLANGCKGPIFFYTGNEGDVTSFWNNTGFVTQVLAPTFGGLLVFAEHRYYGESKPFGNKSLTPDYVGYLTSEQALADYAELITYLKSQHPDMQKCPVIAVGGSYGGMLTAWFRLKYPNIVAGGLAASAPIGLFYGTGASQYGYMDIVTQDFANYSAECPQLLRTGLQWLTDNANNASALLGVQQQMHLCANVTTDTVGDVINWATSAFTSLAEVDYPYPANFLMPLPAWPVNVACKQALANSGSPLAAVAAAAGVYYNSTGEAGSCYPLYEPSGLGTQGWDYQACTEMIMPISASNSSMFPPYNYSLDATTAFCEKLWDVIPRPHWVPMYYGGFNISAGSNIIFSNGQLDPWRSGGVTKSLGPSLIALYVINGAHHLDLRGPNPADPNSVIVVREIEAQWIYTFIQEYVKQNP